MRSMTALAMTALLAAMSSGTAVCETADDMTTTTISMDESLDALQTHFNQHRGQLRFVTLLSPT